MGAKNAAWRWKAPRKHGCCDYCGKLVRVFKTGRSARWCSTFCASMGQHGYRGGRGAQPVRVLWGGVVAEATALVFAAVSNAGQRDDGTGASV